ncbi:winged helix-turn-helix transcriptional regulator [Kineobactrum salinum]|uniref:Helix-turn-helix transcriptional regulator n=1 Tax=Kineobactrum salinum TaxID=2708301 RepID=A0A6C0U147_9GAMM|nr:helix-turn-helix domain-containing protein [Kineobactrum salinum]QIB65289.1 helix-turn-helix transcriptional regulator [Kineobactrum salinum]
MSKPKLLPKSSVNRALNALGDRWSLLIIQQAFLGTSRFEEFRSRCNIPRSTLSHRLKSLIGNQILETRPHVAGKGRQSYYLTERGRALLDAVLLAWAWGIRWGMISDGLPTSIIHHDCGKPMIPKLACDECGGEVTLRSCHREPGPGEGYEQLKVQRMHRRRYAADELYASDVVDLLGDRWTGMVIATQYFGIHRFDHMQTYLNIASNILADRLKALEFNGILERSLYELMPPRYEYWLTKKGSDLFPHALSLMLWADEWLADVNGPPVLVRHNPCGHLLGASVVCGQCEQPLTQDNVTPRLQAATGRPSRAAGKGR